MNLQKLYPHIPTSLNNILMYFSVGSDVYYELAEELIADLTQCLYTAFEWDGLGQLKS